MSLELLCILYRNLSRTQIEIGMYMTMIIELDFPRACINGNSCLNVMLHTCVHATLGPTQSLSGRNAATRPRGNTQRVARPIVLLYQICMALSYNTK